MKLTPDETVTRNLILKELAEQNPVRIETEAAVPYQYFQLKFSDQVRSLDLQTEDYRLLLIQEDGRWICRDLYADAAGIPEKDQ